MKLDKFGVEVNHVLNGRIKVRTISLALSAGGSKKKNGSLRGWRPEREERKVADYD